MKVGLGDVKVLSKVVANLFGEVNGSNGRSIEEERSIVHFIVPVRKFVFCESAL